MRLSVVTLLVTLLVASALGQLKLSGVWERTECECFSVISSCDAIWRSVYELEGENGNFTSVDPLSPFVVTQNQITGISTHSGPGSTCTGVFGKSITCRDADRRATCTVTFTCRRGDCVGSVVQQNMRSTAFPVIASVVGLVWIGWAIGGKFIPSKLHVPIVMILSGICLIAGAFLLFVPPTYEALVLMAVSAFAFNAAKAGGSFEIKLAAGACLFASLMFWGLNFITYGFTDNDAWFDKVMNGFNSESCYLYFGVDLDSPRCREYSLYAALIGFFASLILPLIALSLGWVTEKVKGRK